MIDIIKDSISLLRYAALNLSARKREIVLVYHSVEDIKPEKDPYKMNVTPFLFEKQVSYLSDLCIRKGWDITVTFDDGFGNFFRNAFPVILRYNIKAIVFVTTDFIDGRSSFDDLFDRGVNAGPLSWEQIREISDAGVEIGSHAVTHSNLKGMDTRELKRQVSDSKKRIEDMTGRKAVYFAYPYGTRRSFDENAKEILKSAGYKKAWTNVMGFNAKESDPYELRRIRVYGQDNIFRFRMKVQGAYNWVDRFN